MSLAGGGGERLLQVAQGLMQNTCPDSVRRCQASIWCARQALGRCCDVSLNAAAAGVMLHWRWRFPFYLAVQQQQMRSTALQQHHTVSVSELSSS